MSNETKPGLPTVEQVRDHERHGGRWRWNAPGKPPCFYYLGVIDDEVWVSWQEDGTPCIRLSHLENGTWTPCDQHGDRLGLVEERAFHASWSTVWKDSAKMFREQRNAARGQLEEANATLIAERKRFGNEAKASWHREQELEAALAQSLSANDGMAERLAAAQARIVGLETALEAAREANEHAAMAENELTLVVRELPSLFSQRQKRVHERVRDVVETRRQLRLQAKEAHDLLGDPDTPEGKALRALVRAARSGWSSVDRRYHDTILAGELRLAVGKGDFAQASAGLAVLLARREQAPAHKTWSREQGDAIRQRRKRAGLSLGELARAVGIGLAELSSIELGKDAPRKLILTGINVALENAEQGTVPTAHPEPTHGPAHDPGLAGLSPGVAALAVEMRGYAAAPEPERRTCGVCKHFGETGCAHPDGQPPAVEWPMTCPGFEARDP